MKSGPGKRNAAINVDGGIESFRAAVDQRFDARNCRRRMLAAAAAKGACSRGVAALSKVVRSLGVASARACRSPGRRGPTPKLPRQLERLSRLPKAQQQVILAMLDGVLLQHR